MGLEKRTRAGLGDELVDRLRSQSFCVVGCGGTGANFADMLVRTGARRLSLIDGTSVKKSGLNRVLGFAAKDVGRPKVEVLESRLRAIAGDTLDVQTLHDSFRRPEQILEGNAVGQAVRDAVYRADVVFSATDTTSSRRAIEQLCRDKDGGALLSCGIWVDGEAGEYRYECAWSPRTPEDRPNRAGYGPKNASFASIVLEATSMAFTMLLSHLRSGERTFRLYKRSYDADFVPTGTVVE